MEKQEPQKNEPLSLAEMLKTMVVNTGSDEINRQVTGVINGDPILIMSQQCPHILSATPYQDSDIIVIQKLTQRKLIPSLTSTPGHHSKGSLSEATIKSQIDFPEDLDVTGSPLKCPFKLGDMSDLSPFTIDHREKEQIHQEVLPFYPLYYPKAFKLASQVNTTLSKLCKQSVICPSVWVVADGSDKKRTVLYGMENDGTCTTRTVVTSPVAICGSDNLPTLDDLKIEFFYGCPNKRVESIAKAWYEVLTTEGEDRSGSSIQLTCKWKEPLTLMSSPAADAVTTVNLSVLCSDSCSVIHEMYLELRLLDSLVNGLTTKEITWYLRSDQTSMNELLQIVFSVLKEKGQRVKNEGNPTTEDEDPLPENRLFQHRQNLDFTDMLWVTLMKSESYQELADSLHMVFKAIAAGHIRPKIHIKNKTQVGKEAQALMRGQKEPPELSGMQPLQMLIEIGVDKIKRDYINIFHVGELATSEQLAQFVGPELDNLQLNERVDQLKQLHITLQAHAVLHDSLKLPSTTLAQYNAKIISQVKSRDIESNHLFEFSIEASILKKQLDGLIPSKWEVSFYNTQKDFSKRMHCTFGRNRLKLLTEGQSDFQFPDIIKDDKSDDYYPIYIITVQDNMFI